MIIGAEYAAPGLVSTSRWILWQSAKLRLHALVWRDPHDTVGKWTRSIHRPPSFPQVPRRYPFFCASGGSYHGHAAPLAHQCVRRKH